MNPFDKDRRKHRREVLSYARAKGIQPNEGPAFFELGSPLPIRTDAQGKCDSPSYTFKSKAEAEKAGGALGLSGSHTHTNEKEKPFTCLERITKSLRRHKGRQGHEVQVQAARDAMYQKRLKDMGARKKGKKGDGTSTPTATRKRRRSPPTQTA